MRLKRLALENWRGIESCEVNFSDGVTIVEGPNEAGKSTLVEALLTLIRELDSSKKQAIRAIMPAGRDVGSRVEAEIETGEYHFVYSKTYNKSPQTTLAIDAPRREQLSGREAHERVEAILNETVDLALWEALLTEQGKSLHPADLKDSEGLSHALDEAAGTAATGQEDMDLYEAAQAEYEIYYTLKAGRPKFADLERDHAEAEAARDAAEAALAEVERDAHAHERAAADVRRRRQAIPGLREKVGQHEESWRAVDKLKRELELRERDLESARDRKTARQKTLEEREALAGAVVADEVTLGAQKKALQPLVDRAAELGKKVDSARLVAEDRRKKRKVARDRLAIARNDLACLEDLDRIASNEKRLATYAEISKKLSEAAEILHGIAIDDEGLEAVRNATHELDKAKSNRDLAATRVTVSAERPLDFTLADEAVSLAAGEAEERMIASGLEIRFPGVASVTVAPPRSAAQLQTEHAEAKETLEQLLAHYRVAGLAEAIEQNEARRAAEGERKRLKARAIEILGDATVEEIEQEVRSLRERKDAYLAQRTSDSAMPQTLAEARDELAAAEQAFSDEEATLEKAQQQEAELRKYHAEADDALREAKEALIGLEATLGDKQQRLEAARAEAPDDVLDEKCREATDKLERLEAEVADVRRRLEAQAPDAIETLYTNAKEALLRSERDLAEAERNLAVLEDRLGRARADGRFETREAAERRVEATHAELAATRRRAAAAERLWLTLNRHRDAARQAYVAPLKEAIERLGRIVFGQDFEVAIGDDWTLESRTLDGITLPFDSLSVGAREQLGILVRLAAAGIVASEGGVPLVIDDALGFSDPSRLETMGAAISAAGQECQIIILTCTPGRFTHVGSATVVGF